MHGLWVGPLKVSEFMDAFMKTTKRLPRSRLAKVKFTSVPTISASEHDMSHSFIDIVKKHGLLPSGWVLRETMGDGKAGKKDEPRMLLCNEQPGASGSHWKSAEMWIDINPTTEMDAFRTDVEDLSTSLDDVTEDAKRTRRRITSYTTTQLGRQHRTSTLSLLICGRHARFIRWDRSGAVVSHHFDYCAEPLPLAEFFWRYGRLSRAERGFDPTARAATRVEESRLHTAISTHLSDPTKRKISKMERSTDPNFPAHVLTVTSSGGPTLNYVVQRPFSPPDSSTGRCTRAYIALDLASDELVFLKDYWRPIDGMRLPEADIYSSLQESGVPHLPQVRVGSDVPWHNGSPQCTLTQVWKDAQETCANGALIEYRHHRIIQDLAYPLSSVKNSRQLVATFRHTLECILSARKSNWLHRDVSHGNVMLNEDGDGILNDWDHGFLVDGDVAPEHRTGTWQFLSIGLASNPKKPQDVLDDIESCFWVLLYSAVHHFESTADRTILTMFDYRDQYMAEEMTGGGQKLGYLCGCLDLEFTCPPLQDLISQLRHHFRAYNFNEGPLVEIVEIATILRYFDDALARTDWPEADVLRDRFPGEQRPSVSSLHSVSDFQNPVQQERPAADPHRRSSIRLGKRRIMESFDNSADSCGLPRTGSSKRPKKGSSYKLVDTPSYKPEAHAITVQ
ncbi:hypothetical protein BXZ70DRAFT_1008742 [Cristinia sonorae]|uniref:Fungal-type protein kinase domain-containing protein n=1 Tax=Cristinia sonorae TaxID=1940300 RepID=A0A8K0UP67_9AGAR|nr:hypothetical protein BXZ70DRAFT_1008742 [Cristinia sonorae]